MRRSLFQRWIFRITLSAGLAVGIGYLPYRAYGPDGVARSLRLESDLQQVVRRNQELRQENSGLRKRINALKQDRSAIEQVARDELGLVRAEDIVFQFE